MAVFKMMSGRCGASLMAVFKMMSGGWGASLTALFNIMSGGWGASLTTVFKMMSGGWGASMMAVFKMVNQQLKCVVFRQILGSVMILSTDSSHLSFKIVSCFKTPSSVGLVC